MVRDRTDFRPALTAALMKIHTSGKSEGVNVSSTGHNRMKEAERGG